VALLVVASAVSLGVIWQRMEPLPLSRAEALSVTVLDRNDRLLRAYTTPDGRWRLPVEVKDVDPRYLAMLLAFEDKRFRSHHGVGPLRDRPRRLAARAACRIVSGGSTLTMQVARLLAGEHERSGAGKLRQALRALALERKLLQDKHPAALSPSRSIRWQPRGVRAGVACLLRKEPRRLSLAEGRAPRSPCRSRRSCAVRTASPEAARRARNRVLGPCGLRRASSRTRRPRVPWPSACRPCAASFPCSPRTSRCRGGAEQDAPRATASPSIAPPRRA
jgi:penicillin-binding protein 1C